MRGGAGDEVEWSDGKGVGEHVDKGSEDVRREEAQERVERDGDGARQSLRYPVEEEAHDAVHVAGGVGAAEGEVTEAVAPEARVGGQKLFAPALGCNSADV
jgi:hypothetical protein